MTAVYESIAEVTGELAKVGIAKGRKNVQQGYAFRGIDDIYSALSGLLSSHKLCVLPRVAEKEVVERTSSKGGLLLYTTLKVEFDFVSAKDGSKHTVVTLGEAMDSGDKSCNKAMSAAYKYACLQTFCIPTEGDNDADGTTHEVAAAAPPRDKPPFTPKPNGKAKPAKGDAEREEMANHSFDGKPAEKPTAKQQETEFGIFSAFIKKVSPNDYSCEQKINEIRAKVESGWLTEAQGSELAIRAYAKSGNEQKATECLNKCEKRNVFDAAKISDLCLAIDSGVIEHRALEAATAAG